MGVCARDMFVRQADPQTNPAVKVQESLPTTRTFDTG